MGPHAVRGVLSQLYGDSLIDGVLSWCEEDIRSCGGHTSKYRSELSGLFLMESKDHHSRHTHFTGTCDSPRLTTETRSSRDGEDPSKASAIKQFKTSRVDDVELVADKDPLYLPLILHPIGA